MLIYTFSDQIKLEIIRPKASRVLLIEHTGQCLCAEVVHVQ